MTGSEPNSPSDSRAFARNHQFPSRGRSAPEFRPPFPLSKIFGHADRDLFVAVDADWSEKAPRLSQHDHDEASCRAKGGADHVRNRSAAELLADHKADE